MKNTTGALQTTRKGRKVNAQQEKTSKIHKYSCICFNDKGLRFAWLKLFMQN